MIRQWTVCFLGVLILYANSENKVLAQDELSTLLMSAQRAEAQGKWADALDQLNQAAKLAPNSGDVYSLRGGVQFKLGHIEQSLADFDQQIRLRPKDAAAHWRRGLTLYYAKKYQEGVAQFVTSDRAEPEDVENAVWHLLCNAKVAGVEKARAKALKISKDSRIPMMEVYSLFLGRATPEKVLHVAEAGETNEDDRRHRRFYAHLYVGLYFEMMGDGKKSLEHLAKAVKDYPITHYMMDVARVHVQSRKKEAK